MRGFLVGLIAVGLCLAACGGAKESEFDEDPDTGGQSGQGGSSATGGSGGSTGGGANAGKSGGSVCDPGATQMCLGPGACEGAQRCATDGQSWEDCDCGSTGTGGSDTGGTGGGTSGTGGASGSSGSNGGAGSSGMGGSMGGGGTTGMAQCATDLCPDYCEASTGHCPEDATLAQCASWCANDRCVLYEDCIAQHNDYLRCMATGTPVCVSDTSLPADVDCHAEGAALFDCLELPWHCDEEDGACICGRGEGAATGEPMCTQTYECCLVDAAGVTCGCGDRAFCDAVGPGFAPIDHCPL